MAELRSLRPSSDSADFTILACRVVNVVLERLQIWSTLPVHLGLTVSDGCGLPHAGVSGRSSALQSHA
jgi:hypothetical protein